jgi:ribosomal protein S18 acetylase RimI-like enzyme
MATTSIRKAQHQDHTILATIGKQTIIESHGSSASEEVMNTYVTNSFNLDKCKEELSNPNYIYHFIYHNEQPAGYSKIIYNTPHPAVIDQQVTKLERLYLLQEFYSLKLGHQLFQFNVALSKEQGQQGMWLYVWKENHRAINFYNKAGFQIVGDGFFKLTENHSNPNYVMYLKY